MAHEPVAGRAAGVVIRDCTLREGRDVPGVEFSMDQSLRIARLLALAKVPEIEVVAPGRVSKDLACASRLKAEGLELRTSGLVYASSPRCREDIEAVSKTVDRVDLLMPLSERRAPHERSAKKSVLLDALAWAKDRQTMVGVGFPHSTQADPGFLVEMSQAGVERGAARIVIYDTNGSSDPFAIDALIRRLKACIAVPLYFHAHNDLGLATANSLAAARAGADGLDTTVNGLGDRAGNASLEQVAMLLHLRGFQTGISLSALKPLSEAVEQESRIEVSKLAPVVGAFIATHKSPGHLEALEQFEAFDASLVGLARKIDA